MISRTKIAALCTVVAFAFPAIGFAQTVDAQTQMKSLLDQIKALQSQLMTMMSSSSIALHPMEPMGTTTRGTDDMRVGTSTSQMPRQDKPCVALNRALKIGSSGDDVSQIQQMLSQDSESGFSGAITGFFGPLTAKAMAKFQIRMSIASSTDGSVGPKTRDFLKKMCVSVMGSSGPDQNNPASPMPNMPGISPNHDGLSTSTRPMPPMPNEHGDNGTGIHPVPPVSDGRGSGVLPTIASLIKGAALVNGTVTQNSGTSLTIQTDGGTKTVLVSSTAIITTASASSTLPTTISIGGISIGAKVRAIGTSNADGTITANFIQTGDLKPINF
ncbi:MAG: hypothetical protein JWM46_168 [Candidatus Kaiserbacteria bacterium]|nr:hypothetical protein [Candidatus Kaiserbacteria bacterium]